MRRNVDLSRLRAEETRLCAELAIAENPELEEVILEVLVALETVVCADKRLQNRREGGRVERLREAVAYYRGKLLAVERALHAVMSTDVDRLRSNRDAKVRDLRRLWGVHEETLGTAGVDLTALVPMLRKFLKRRDDARAIAKTE